MRPAERALKRAAVISKPAGLSGRKTTLWQGDQAGPGFSREGVATRPIERARAPRRAVGRAVRPAGAGSAVSRDHDGTTRMRRLLPPSAAPVIRHDAEEVSAIGKARLCPGQATPL